MRKPSMDLQLMKIKQDIYVVSKYLHRNHLFITKGKIITVLKTLVHTLTWDRECKLRRLAGEGEPDRACQASWKVSASRSSCPIVMRN